ncbi:MAG: hypothetical protein HY842_11080 [Bacteroidetes bacterium]|nr:hypothetical protein [Bacteroidota bacterium]
MESDLSPVTKNCFLSLLCGAFNAVLLLPLNAQEGGSNPSQPPVLGEQAFRSMSPAQRFAFARDFPFWKSDSATVSLALRQFLPIAAAKNDSRTAFALKLHQYHQRSKLKLKQADILQLLSEMEVLATAHEWEVETVVARHYIVFEKYDLNEIPIEQKYTEVLNTFGRMEDLGFEQFRDYEGEGILFDLSQFMYGLEDLEKMFEYLGVAERFIQFTEKGQYHTILVLNYLETYYQRKKDYPKAIGYAQKILQFSRELVTTHPETEWRRRFWEGFASLDIASMLAEQGKLEEGEQYADEGYESSKAGYPGRPFASLRGEYDASQVLLAIKLKTGKLDEAAVLIRRAEELQKKLDTDAKIDQYYFEPLKFYNNCARYYELRGDAAAALRYTRLAQTLQDSLDRRNDARKFEQIQQRLDAEKYTEQLRLVENEKELQKWLRNAALLILALVLALAFGWFHRQQHLRRQREAELESAKNDLETFTKNFREKSELVENLRLEIEKLSRSGERSQYLEQLTHSVILTEEDWSQFRAVFEKVHPDFIAEQKTAYPDITPAELRLLVLEKLGLGAHEMANMLGVSLNTVYKTGQRLRKKTASGL